MLALAAPEVLDRGLRLPHPALTRADPTALAPQTGQSASLPVAPVRLDKQTTRPMVCISRRHAIFAPNAAVFLRTGRKNPLAIPAPLPLGRGFARGPPQPHNNIWLVLCKGLNRQVYV